MADLDYSAGEFAGRDHEVLVESWERWREPVQELGLEFAAAQQYTVFPPPAPGSGDASAAEAARTLVPLLQDWKPDAVVTVEMPSEPVKVAIDRVLMRRVVANLVTNAIQAAGPGKAKVWIRGKARAG